MASSQPGFEPIPQVLASSSKVIDEDFRKTGILAKAEHYDESDQDQDKSIAKQQQKFLQSEDGMSSEQTSEDPCILEKDSDDEDEEDEVDSPAAAYFSNATGGAQ